MPNPMELIELCQGHRVFLQTHNYPDPDAIASAYALQELFKKFDIKATICYDGTIEKVSTKRMVSMFGIEIIQAADISDMTESDYIITVDGQKHNSNFTDLIGDEVACIDHHPTFIPCEYHYKDVQIVGACSSIVASYFKELKIKPSKNVATALVYGIKMDTSDFIRGGTELDSDMFAFLFPRSDRSKIVQLYSNVMEVQDLKAYATAIDNIRIFDRCGFAVLNYDCPDAIIATISDFILSLDVVEVSVVYSVREDGLKFSVRSEIDQLDAGKLIYEVLKDYGGGGGHKTMAGGFIPNEGITRIGSDYPQKLESMFLSQLEKMLAVTM